MEHGQSNTRLVECHIGGVRGKYEQSNIEF